MSNIECISSEQRDLINYEENRAWVRAITQLNSIDSHRLVKLASKRILVSLSSLERKQKSLSFFKHNSFVH